MSKISPYSLYSALCSIHFTVGNSERVTLWSSHLSAEFNCPNRVTVMLFPRVKGLMCDKMMPSELLSGIGQRTSFERKRLRWAVIVVWTHSLVDACDCVKVSVVSVWGCGQQSVSWTAESSAMLWNVSAYSSDSQKASHHALLGRQIILLSII